MTTTAARRLLTEDHAANLLINGAIEAIVVAVSNRQGADEWSKDELRAKNHGRGALLMHVIPAIEKALVSGQ